MWPQDGTKRIRQNEVCILRIGLMHVYYLMYFYYLQLFLTSVLSLHKPHYLLLYLHLPVKCGISAEPLYVCQPTGVYIGKLLPDLATTDDTVLYVILTRICNSYEVWYPAIRWDYLYKPRMLDSWKSKTQGVFHIHCSFIPIDYLFTLVLLYWIYCSTISLIPTSLYAIKSDSCNSVQDVSDIIQLTANAVR